MAETSCLVNLLPEGGDEAKNKLISYASERLLRLARNMLKNYPGVRRWEQTDDIGQHALMRLHRALSEAKVLSSCHFWKLAALQIRRELIDMARRHQGPEGIGTNHHTDGAGKAADDSSGPLQRIPDGGDGPDSLEDWTRFHSAVESLPEFERQVVGLIFYDGLKQIDAADQLGVTLDIVKKRWLSARLKLGHKLSAHPLRSRPGGHQ